MIGRMYRPGWGGLLLALLLAALPGVTALGRTAAEALVAGKAALEDGLYDLARRELEQCLSLVNEAGRDTVVGHEAAVQLLRVLHEQKQAEEVLKLVQGRRSPVRAYLGEAETVFWNAWALHELSRSAEALALLDRYESRFPGTAYVGQAIRLRGWCQLRLGRTDAAIECFRSFDAAALGIPAEEDRNLLEWGRVLMEAGRQDEAVEVLSRLARKPGQRPEILEGQYWLGRLRVDGGDWERAVQVLGPLLENVEAGADLRADTALLMGRAYESAKAYANAVTVLKRGLNLATSSMLKREIGFALGRIMLDTDQMGAGVALLKTLIAESPHDALAEEAQLRLSSALLQSGKADEAATEFQHYLETYTNVLSTARAHAGRGSALLRLGRNAEAATAFLKASKLLGDPQERAGALLKAADAYRMNRQFMLAADVYRQIVRDFPDMPVRVRAEYQVGECLAQDGQEDAAEAQFRAVVGAYPKDPVAEESLLRIAMMRENAKRFPGALEAYEDLMRRYPGGSQFPEALYGRGMALYGLSRYGEALRDFERLIQEHPSSRRVEGSVYRRSLCLFWMGQEADAMARWEEFLKQYPQSTWAPDVVFWIAKTEYNQQHYEAAELRFVEFSDRYPNRPEAADGLFWAGMAAMERREFVRAIELLTRMIRDYPDTEKMDRARFAQGDALTELARFSDAIVVFNEIIAKYPGSRLVPQAWGRKGDCQFTLGSDDPGRYRESLESYRVVVGSPGATLDQVLQAEYKMGRCLEKLGRTREAFEQYYRAVVVRYLDEMQKGVRHTEIAKVWFTRAAFSAADLMTASSNWKVAGTVLGRVVQAGVPAAEEARERIRRLRVDHPDVFSGTP